MLNSNQHNIHKDLLILCCVNPLRYIGFIFLIIVENHKLRCKNIKKKNQIGKDR